MTTASTALPPRLEAARADVLQAFCDSLDTLAFMFADPPEGEPAAPDGACRVSMTFTGSASNTAGRFELCAGEDFARQLSANVLGCDVDDPEAQEGAADCLGELINVAVGAFTPLLTDDPAETFKLSLPDRHELSPIEWDELAADAQAYEVEGEPILIRLAAA
jgi:hypothetical protein